MSVESCAGMNERMARLRERRKLRKREIINRIIYIIIILILIAGFVALFTQLVWQKDQYSSIYGFPVLMIDLVLRVSVGHALIYVYLAFKP